MSDNASSGMTAIVAIVAIVIVAGLGFFAYKNFIAKDDGGASINLELPEGNNGQP